MVFVAWQDDRAGSYDVYSSSANFPYLFGLSLMCGWNFVSIPTEGYVYRASTLGLKNGDVVVGWNSTTQSYNDAYMVGFSPADYDFAISASTGYWIGAGAHEHFRLKGDIPTVRQYKHVVVPPGGGWDIIGFESLNVTMYASDIPAMLNVPGGIEVVSSYDPVAGEPDTYIAEFPESDFELVPGQAYWCYFNVSGTLSYAP
jgi:hypothetical protein